MTIWSFAPPAVSTSATSRSRIATAPPCEPRISARTSGSTICGTFGSTVIRHADSREVMEWMGHADLATTRRYLAFVDREDAADRVSQAFRLGQGAPRSSLRILIRPRRTDPRRVGHGA
jgi:hypothetical protein